jgi:Amt family ammonium transporter
MENSLIANEELGSLLNNLWLTFATSLVFMMNLGFACLETGLVRSKNATNVLFKNTFIPIVGILVFSGWGYNLMFPGAEAEGGFFGFGGFGFPSPTHAASLPYNYYSKFLFQAMFACTASTIISGAVAERIKLSVFLLFSISILGFIYPVAGMWVWGGGWLTHSLSLPFHDFAGSSVVHTVGGYAALTGTFMLGPRNGKYLDNKIIPIPGHSMPLSIIGLFILWLGWIGFNGGCVTATQPKLLSYVLLLTMLAGCCGGAGALLTSYFINKTNDITMLINGVLAGLVSITAGADIMNTTDTCAIGLIAGILVVFSVLIFDKLRIDDPVGAISVHLVCGTWGTIAVGLFGKLAEQNGMQQLKVQLCGCLSIGIFVVFSSFIILFIIKKIIGLRVNSKKESDGLDLSDHGMKAYHFEEENKY